MLRLLAFLTCALVATPGLARPLTEAAAADLALKHNPELAAARLALAEARARAARTGRLDNPVLESELRPNLRGREFSVELGFSQKFPLTRRLALEKAVSAAAVEAAAGEILHAEQQLAAEVRSDVVKAQALGAASALATQQAALSRELAAQAARTAAAGETSPLDVTPLELDAAKLDVDAARSAAERDAALAALRPLLGLRPEATLEVADSLPEPAAPVAGAPDFSRRGDVAAAQARLGAARTAIDLARAGKWEDIDVGLVLAHERSEDAPEGLKNDVFGGIRVAVPLPLWNDRSAHVAEATTAAARAEKELAALKAKISGEAATARAEMTAQAKLHARIASELLPKARQMEYQLATTARAGQSPASEALRARRQRLELEAAQLTARRDHHLARIRLQAALGRLLP